MIFKLKTLFGVLLLVLLLLLCVCLCLLLVLLLVLLLMLLLLLQRFCIEWGNRSSYTSRNRKRRRTYHSTAARSFEATMKLSGDHSLMCNNMEGNHSCSLTRIFNIQKDFIRSIINLHLLFLFVLVVVDISIPILPLLFPFLINSSHHKFAIICNNLQQFTANHNNLQQITTICNKSQQFATNQNNSHVL